MLMSNLTREDPRAMRLPADHPSVPAAKVGLLLMNLGTPEGTDYWSMRRYLSEFLSDRRVIDLNPMWWDFLLHFVILSKRPFTSGRAYRSIWNEELDESPLRTITRSQAELLSGRLAARYPELVVDWAMRYGKPSIRTVLERMGTAGCSRIVLLPLYPQYAGSTMATAYDKAFDALKRMNWQPAIRTAPPYHDEPLYIEALARSIEVHLATLDFEPEVVITSFHGLPKRYLTEKGDPYHCQCHKTNRLLRERLGWSAERLPITFQSRFGSEEWLQPYTDATVRGLAEQGVRRLAILAPGFSADCVETLEELCEEVKEEFLDAGGERFSYIPCLNDSEDGMDVIEAVALRELQGWL
jgi:ferrochelatase